MERDQGIMKCDQNESKDDDLSGSDDSFEDNYVHVDPNVFYTTHNIPGPGIDFELFYSQISRSCKCIETENTETSHEQDALKNFESSQATTSTRNTADNSSCSAVEHSPKNDQSSTSTMNKLESKLINEITHETSEYQLVNLITTFNKEVCDTNCSCNSSANYINGKLNVLYYKLPIYECNNLCSCKRRRNSVDNDDRHFGYEETNRNTVVLNEISNQDGANFVNETTKRNSIDLNEISNRFNKRNMVVKCCNRVIQNGPSESLTIFKHSITSKGYGVKSIRRIEKGDFICEYVGEVIGKSEAKRRYELYKNDYKKRQDGNCNFYIFHLKEIAKTLGCELDEPTSMSNDPFVEYEDTEKTLNLNHEENSEISEDLEKIQKEHSNDIGNTLDSNESPLKYPRIPTFEMFIDATQFGNIARYINHSCQPNCSVLPIRVNSVFPSLAIFAHRDILEGEEITYDYEGLNDEDEEFDVDSNRTKEGITTSNKTDENNRGKYSEELLKENRKICFCGQKKCRKFLPYLPL
ncbi:hypothetical protein WDU94_001997 [Cyamophila willieti]